LKEYFYKHEMPGFFGHFALQ